MDQQWRSGLTLSAHSQKIFLLICGAILQCCTNYLYNNSDKQTELEELTCCSQTQNEAELRLFLDHKLCSLTSFWWALRKSCSSFINVLLVSCRSSSSIVLLLVTNTTTIVKLFNVTGAESYDCRSAWKKMHMKM